MFKVVVINSQDPLLLPSLLTIPTQVDGGWAATAVGTGELRMPGYEPDSATLKNKQVDPDRVPKVFGLLKHGVPFHNRVLWGLTLK